MSWFVKGTKRAEVGADLRRIHLIDLKLQMPLIVAIVILEVIILGGAVLYLHGQFQYIFETSAYSIDPTPGQSMVSMFLKELGTVILTMSITNTLLLLVIHKLWLIGTGRTLQRLKMRLQRIQSLDLQAVGDGLSESSHAVLGLLDTWRLQELERQQRIARLLEQLPVDAATLSAEEREAMVLQLQRCRELL